MDKKFFKFLEEVKGKLMDADIPNLDGYFKELSHFNPLFDEFIASVFAIDFRQDKFIYISPNTLEITGYSAPETMAISVSEFMQKYHPVDLQIVSNQMFPAGNKALMKIPVKLRKSIKVSYNFRLLQEDGSYRNLLQQFSVLKFDPKFGPLVILGTMMNVEGFMDENCIQSKVFIKNPINHWQMIYAKKYSITEKSFQENVLTKKELDILRLAAQGKASKEIAHITGNSIETIHKHRKNIIEKTQCSNITQAILLAVDNNWL